MKKLTLLCLLLTNAYFAKAANEGFTFYNEILGKWEYIFCSNITVEQKNNEYVSTQFDEKRPGYFLDPGDAIKFSTEKKVAMENKVSYGGKVGAEAVIGIFKALVDITVSYINTTTHEIKVSEELTSFKGKPEYQGIGFQAYTQLTGKRIGTYCFKRTWDKNNASNIWEWKQSLIAKAGPHPDGFIYDDQSGNLWFWANWKFVPDASSPNSSNALVVNWPILQWGKRFYQEGRQGFKISDKNYLSIGVNDIADYTALDSPYGLTLVDESGSDKFILASNNYTSDKKWNTLDNSTFTFKAPIGLSGEGLRGAYYMPPGVGRIYHIVSGTITMQLQPTVKILAIDNLVYTKTGLDRVTYDSKGVDFLCTTPKGIIDNKYPTTIYEKLPPGVQPLGYKYW